MYRPLLPAPTEGSDGDQEPPQRPGKSSGRIKPNIQIACETCRRRKTRCDGQRPKCSSCVARNEECVFQPVSQETNYQALKRRLEQVEHSLDQMNELYAYLKTKPYEEALEILARIRSSDDVRAVLAFIKEGDLLLQLASTDATDATDATLQDQSTPSNTGPDPS